MDLWFNNKWNDLTLSCTTMNQDGQIRYASPTTSRSISLLTPQEAIFS